MKTIDKLKNKVIQGDCLEILKQIPDKSINLILQDPPYFTTKCPWEWDIMTKIDELWTEWKRVIKDNGTIVMTASQPFTSKLVMSNLKMFKYEWIWEKSNGGGFLLANKVPLKRHENILIFAKKQLTYNPQKTKGKPYICKSSGGTKFLGEETSKKIAGWVTKNNGDRYPISVIKIPSETGLHPTQKPVALMEYLIKTYTNKGDIVFDGFAGSFTTAVACDNLKRDWICCDIDKEYCEIGKKRINDNRIKLNSNLLEGFNLPLLK